MKLCQTPTRDSAIGQVELLSSILDGLDLDTFIASILLNRYGHFEDFGHFSQLF